MTAEDYLRRVWFALHDLPWRTKRELIAEIRSHLEELPPETDLAVRLGLPEQYTADMRSAAGLERRRGALAFLRARRPRNLVLIVVVLTVIGLAIGAVVWIDSYQPLVFGNGTMNPEGAVEAPVGGVSVVFHEGRPFRYGFTVRNDGRYTVRVLGVPEVHGLPIAVRVLMSGPTRNGGMPLPSGRFRPLDLKPGYTLALYLQGVYHARAGDCGPGSFSEILYSFPVRFSFLWKTATTDIPLPENLAIVTKGRPCR